MPGAPLLYHGASESFGESNPNRQPAGSMGWKNQHERLLQGLRIIIRRAYLDDKCIQGCTSLADGMLMYSDC